LVEPGQRDVRALMGDPGGDKVRNLGLLLDEAGEIPGAALAAGPKNKLQQRIERLADAVTGTWDQEVMRQFPEEICRIGVKGIGTLDFDMSEERLEMLVNSGRCAVTEYLQKRRLTVK